MSPASTEREEAPRPNEHAPVDEDVEDEIVEMLLPVAPCPQDRPESVR